jgi:cytochrome c-type biogenesis protein
MMVLFAFIAGILSILSPCVLPLIPIVLGTALSEHKLGPIALSVGVAISFTAIGLFIATIGFAAGINANVFETAAAIMLVLIGVVLCVPALQMRLATAAGPISVFAQDRFGGFSSQGLFGQFGVGLLLGAIWSPCTGPTLGAASLMAARSQHLWLVALVMLAYGIGAGLPMMVLGFLSRETLMRWKGGMMQAGKGMKQAMGAMLVVLGVFMLSGLDKTVETKLVDASPAWLTSLTTHF